VTEAQAELRSRTETDTPPGSPEIGEARRGRRNEKMRAGAVVLLVLLGTVGFALWLDRFYPIRHWLFFHYALCWLYAGLFSAACLAAGLRLLHRLLPEPPVLGERLTLGFAMGVLVFFWGMFLAGLAGLLGQALFFAWPLAMLAYGGPYACSLFLQLRWRGFGTRLVQPRGATEVLGAALLLLGVVAVYLQVMTPTNLGADAHGYHLPIAEQYVATGMIRPFAEGWYLGAYPHLASILYTWAFLAPGGLSLHTALSSHVEWALFLATLGGVSVLAGRLLGRRATFAAAVVFLFPGLFLSDSNLITGADHVLAFWAVPVALSLLRLGEKRATHDAVLAGLLIGAAVLTKYQGSYMFVAGALGVLIVSVRFKRPRLLLAWALAGLLASSAHWLKNWIFYGDPFYPLGCWLFATHPFHRGAQQLFDRIFWMPWFAFNGTRWQKAVETVRVMATFSFEPHNWGSPFGLKPVFGSLFTLLIPALPLLRPKRALWMLVLAANLGVAVWFLTSAQDRFLQSLLPWMAACTAAMLALAWQMGLLVRAAVVALVALQLVWGGDIYFYRQHGMVPGGNPLKALVDHLGSGQEHRYEERDRPVADLWELGQLMPRGSKPVLHGLDGRLGLGHAFLVDEIGWQGAIDYAVLESPVAAFTLWRKLGATHVSWFRSRGSTSPEDLAREAVFARALQQYTNEGSPAGGRLLAKLMDAPKDMTLANAPTRIAWLGCGGDPVMGVYTPGELAHRSAPREVSQGWRLAEGFLRQDPLKALTQANALIVRASCDAVAKTLDTLRTEFETPIDAGDVSVWVRNRASTR
jgi:hypothetical protein